jgi:1,4-dihydroxy-2-naphthoyl-CoA synthase
MNGLLKRSLHRGFSTEINNDLNMLNEIYGSAELKEGRAAFLEKREPIYPL